MRWTVGIVLGFLVVFAVNGLMAYLALNNAPKIEPSYSAEAR